MPTSQAGRIIKVQRHKRRTPHNKNHRWESFTTKISRLKTLDPIRKIKRHELLDDNASSTASYFQASLCRWQEVNLSENFQSFSRRVQPWSDSLPHVLHFQSAIVDALIQHIEKGEKWSLEPLLELLTQLAHDLGSRFEAHYERSLKVLIKLAGTPGDVEIIEWTFSALAFLFKYLSRLLVPNLRPTYEVVAPLLGKQRCPPHIARFAAEALSYLLKKAAVPAHRKGSLIDLLVHIRADVQSTIGTPSYALYSQGVMTLFAEAAKGNGQALHTTACALLEKLFQTVIGETKGPPALPEWEAVVLGTVISTIHHSNADTIKDLQLLIVDTCDHVVEASTQATSNPRIRDVCFAGQLIGVLVGVRKATRVSDWQRLLRALSSLTDRLVACSTATLLADLDDLVWQSFGTSVAICIKYAPFEAILSFLDPVMWNFSKEPLLSCFLQFCSLTAQMTPDRFRDLMIPYFERYINIAEKKPPMLTRDRFVANHWSDSDNSDSLCVIIPSLIASNALPRRDGKTGFGLPQSWQDQIVNKFERLETSPFPEQSSAAADREQSTWHDRCLPKYNALLDLLQCVVVHPSTSARISEILHRKLKLSLRPSMSLAPEEANFIAGNGFIAYVQMCQESLKIDTSLLPLLIAAIPKYARLPPYVRAVHQYVNVINDRKHTSESEQLFDLQSVVSPQDASHGNEILQFLCQNLSTGSHELRQMSLKLLSAIQPSKTTVADEALRLMNTIEATPLDHTSTRALSMYIRKLGSLCASVSLGSTIQEAIVQFCFGMMTIDLSVVWTDAVEALKQIAETSQGESMVLKKAMDWISTTMPPSIQPVTSPIHDTQRGLTDFECLNYSQVMRNAALSKKTVSGARDTMLEHFAVAQAPVSSCCANARAQGLQVLAAVPKAAEKRSRTLVPIILRWAEPEVSEDGTAYEEASIEDTWNRKDQKALLEVFALFTNSKSLYKASEVYSVLLSLLGSGDVDIQKAALTAIIIWKDPSVAPYEEHLFNLLDDARFKDEIGVLLQGSDLIQPDHRAQLTPILLRLLYGRAITRKGTSSSKQSMEGRRSIILRCLRPDDVEQYLNITLGALANVDFHGNSSGPSDIFNQELLSVRKQVGFVHMMESFLAELGASAKEHIPQILDPVLYCLVFATRRLSKVEVSSEDDGAHAHQASMLKDIRQIALKCLTATFTIAPERNWAPYAHMIDTEVVEPRRANLAIENSQGISALLRLFSAWTSSQHTVFLLYENSSLFPAILECLTLATTKDEVKLHVLSMISSVVKLALEQQQTGEESLIKEKLLAPNIDNALSILGSALQTQQDMHKHLLEAYINVIIELAAFVATSSQAQNLITVSIFLLDQPARRVNPLAKSGLLQVLERYLPMYDLQHNFELRGKVFSTITTLFGFFKDRASRETLGRVLSIYARSDGDIADVAQLCLELNTFVPDRLDEPDYDRRLAAFNTIREQRSKLYTLHQWLPILYNLLYFIKYEEEFTILASNAADAILGFIDAASEAQEPQQREVFLDTLSSTVLPAMYNGMREASEQIRREHLRVVAHMVRILPAWQLVMDMHQLLAGEGEIEESFFTNVVASGVGRKMQALKLLEGVAQSGQLSSKNVSQLLVPLLEHLIWHGQDVSDAHNVAAEAATCISILASSLDWSQYRAILRRFIGYIQSRSEGRKQLLRLIGKYVDALVTSTVQGGASSASTLSRSIPKHEILAKELNTQILPPLVGYLHDKDETTVSQRVPVAVIVVRLLKLLPQEQLTSQLPAVLIDVCHILRSKAVEARDMARETLTKTCALLGPSYFSFVLKELRGALQKGYQLHVMSYTVHTILVATTPQYPPGSLDYCLPDIVAVIMDDIFGTAGQEKDAEEYVSKMKEVKSSKSQDSMELIASIASVNKLGELVKPIQVLLQEKVNLKMVTKIDELLHRISSGLLRNTGAASQDALVLCYDIIQQYNGAQVSTGTEVADLKLKRYLVQKGANKSGNRGATTVYGYKIVRFAFDVLRALLRKHDDLRTASNIAGFIPILGDAVEQAEEEIKTSAFKLLTTIARVPVSGDVSKDFTALYRIAFSTASKCVAASASTSSSIAQASIKLISVILRDRRDVPVKETAIDELLAKVKHDLTEPEYRHVTFAFLRAVLDAEVETALLYDTLDYVGTVMVTNDDKDTRGLARGAYFQFLREYPQKRSRWAKQLGFIVANLKYDREGGRLSILEVIHLLLLKSSAEYVQEVAGTTFVPVLFVLANDESEKCRVGAAELVKAIFKQADEHHFATFRTMLESWVRQQANPAVLRLAYQSYSLLYEAMDTPKEEGLALLITSVTTTVSATLDDATGDWECLYAALRLVEVLSSKMPNVAFAKSRAPLWAVIHRCLSYPHAWIKLIAAKLTGACFVDFAKANAGVDTGKLPLKGTGELALDAATINVLLHRLVTMLRSPELTEALAEEIIKNILFLARCAEANDIRWTSPGLDQTQNNGDVLHEEDGEDVELLPTESPERTTLAYLFSRLSYLLRQDTGSQTADLLRKSACLQILAQLVGKISVPALQDNMRAVVQSLNHFTDSSITTPHGTDDTLAMQYQKLKEQASTTLETLKRRVGIESYTTAFMQVREEVVERRKDRGVKRKMDAVRDPERWGAMKKKKILKEKERRKVRGQEWKSRRKGL